jgi:hypothetical protein
VRALGCSSDPVGDWMVSQLVEAPGTFLKAAESLIDMRIPTTAQVACVVFAITRFLGTRHGVESRILRAVELPISLARAILGTGPFNSNFHGFYSLLIGEEQAALPAATSDWRRGEYLLSVDFPSTVIVG